MQIVNKSLDLNLKMHIIRLMNKIIQNIKKERKKGAYDA